MSEKKITNALYLPDWTVEDVKKPDRNSYRVEASYDLAPDHCPKCGSIRQPYKHGPVAVDYTDAPVHGRLTTVRVTVQRYRCRDCGKTFNQPLPDMDPKRLMTRRCVEYIEAQGLVSTYARVARDIGVDEKTIRDICNAKIEELLSAHRPTAPVVLGIDELTLDGGHRRSIFTDVGSRRILDLIETMNRPQVERWLSLLPRRERIQLVTMDLWDPYRQAVRVLLPGAKVIADRWHVQRIMNKKLDAIRNRIRRTKTGKGRRNPWRARRLLQSSRHNLSPQRAFVLDGMLKNDPLLQIAWQTKEDFYDIWHGEPTRYEAEKRFDKWRGALAPEFREDFEGLAKTILEWREEVFAFFDHPFTNAYTEAMNGLVKIANRAGRGYRFEAIRARAISMTSFDVPRYAVCEECLGLWPVKPTGSGRDSIQLVSAVTNQRTVCNHCLQIHIQRWFGGHGASTLKSG